MWTSKSDALPRQRGVRLSFLMDTHVMTVADVVNGWQADAGFRSVFNAALAGVPYSEYRWETPAATNDTLASPFECVVLEALGLSRTPTPATFASYFGHAENGVAVFSSLGGDAKLVVPCPAGDSSAYGHLAAFVRTAPETQQQSLWEAVGAAMARRLGTTPVWLSTAGAGVPWLHVRLDDRPKYYSFQPYRDIEFRIQ